MLCRHRNIKMGASTSKIHPVSYASTKRVGTVRIRDNHDNAYFMTTEFADEADLLSQVRQRLNSCRVTCNTLTVTESLPDHLFVGMMGDVERQNYRDKWSNKNEWTMHAIEVQCKRDLTGV